MKTIFEAVVRFRTWLANLLFAALIIAPDLLNSPEILAVIPDKYQRWVLVAAFLVNIWMRPRPAVLATDLEASVSRKKKAGMMADFILPALLIAAGWLAHSIWRLF